MPVEVISRLGWDEAAGVAQQATGQWAPLTWRAVGAPLEQVGERSSQLSAVVAAALCQLGIRADRPPRAPLFGTIWCTGSLGVAKNVNPQGSEATAKIDAFMASADARIFLAPESLEAASNHSLPESSVLSLAEFERRGQQKKFWRKHKKVIVRVPDSPGSAEHTVRALLGLGSEPADRPVRPKRLLGGSVAILVLGTLGVLSASDSGQSSGQSQDGGDGSGDATLPSSASGAFLPLADQPSLLACMDSRWSLGYLMVEGARSWDPVGRVYAFRHASLPTPRGGPQYLSPSFILGHPVSNATQESELDRIYPALYQNTDPEVGIEERVSGVRAVVFPSMRPAVVERDGHEVVLRQPPLRLTQVHGGFLHAGVAADQLNPLPYAIVRLSSEVRLVGLGVLSHVLGGDYSDNDPRIEEARILPLWCGVEPQIADILVEVWPASTASPDPVSDLEPDLGLCFSRHGYSLPHAARRCQEMLGGGPEARALLENVARVFENRSR